MGKKMMLQPKARRKVIQLITLKVQVNEISKALLIALCNDGTMWEKLEDHKWGQLPDIPQPKADDLPKVIEEENS